MKLIRTIALLLFLLPWTTQFTHARIAPGDKQITLSGDTLVAGEPMRMSVIALEQQFELVTIDAYNPWEKRTDSYTGIWLDKLISQLASDKTEAVTFVALDNYQITFERAEWQADKIMLVTRVNGEHQPVRNKGPLRVVYQQFDPKNAAHGINLPKWIWMITRVEFTSDSSGD